MAFVDLRDHSGIVQCVIDNAVDVRSEYVVKITGVPNPGRTMSVLIRGSNELVVGEADRSLHDALCVVRSIVKKRFLLAGGGAPEIELSRRLNAYAKTLPGMDSYCLKAYAEAKVKEAAGELVIVYTGESFCS